MHAAAIGRRPAQVSSLAGSGRRLGKSGQVVAGAGSRQAGLAGSTRHAISFGGCASTSTRHGNGLPAETQTPTHPLTHHARRGRVQAAAAAASAGAGTEEKNRIIPRVATSSPAFFNGQRVRRHAIVLDPIARPPAQAPRPATLSSSRLPWPGPVALVFWLPTAPRATPLPSGSARSKRNHRCATGAVDAPARRQWAVGQTPVWSPAECRL